MRRNGRSTLISLPSDVKIVCSCPRPSLRNDRKQPDRHRCAIANCNARGKIKYDSYLIFKRGSCKMNNCNSQHQKVFARWDFRCERFVNNHLNRSIKILRIFNKNNRIALLNCVYIINNSIRVNIEIWKKSIFCN